MVSCLRDALVEGELEVKSEMSLLSSKMASDKVVVIGKFNQNSFF